MTSSIIKNMVWGDVCSRNLSREESVHHNERLWWSPLNFKMSPTITTDGVGCQKSGAVILLKTNVTLRKEKMVLFQINGKTWIHFYSPPPPPMFNYRN